MPYLKSRLLAFMALALLCAGFTFPMIAFQGIEKKIKEGKPEQISELCHRTWDLYSHFGYISPNTPKEAANDLKKMIETSSEIGAVSLPVWRVSLEAPNYPKSSFPEGIPVLFHLDGFSGEVEEMNTINHYIGMNPMQSGAKTERKIAAYATALISAVMFLFVIYRSRVFSFLMFIPVMMPLLFIADFSCWLYWFGHNLNEWGAFKIKPFMPTVLGEGKVAQFTTHSYPAIGFFVLLAISLLSLLAIRARKKEAA